LHIASFKELDEMAVFLIDNGIDVNVQDKNGQTILHYAALNNQLSIADAALNKGGSLSIEDVRYCNDSWL
jgi:ankyrin repeat protein